MGKEDTLPGGFVVKKGDELAYSAYIIHRLPEYWPDPERFDPDRFLEQPKPFTFLTFHAGPRMCLGMDMTYVQVKVALFTLLRRFRFKLHPGHVVTTVVKILISSKDGMVMDYEGR